MHFIDFCAGIGGGRLGATANNFSCVGFSEIDKKAENTYRLFFDKNELNYGDITKITPEDLPNFDLLLGGFPCQSFSILGARAGFEDLRGQIIFSIADILKKKQTPYFLLENVKGLVSHNRGETLSFILSLLNECGYQVDYKVLNSFDYGVPQLRERIYFVGIRKDLYKKPYIWPTPIEHVKIENFLDNENLNYLDISNATFQKYLNNKYNQGKFNINEILNEDFLVVDTRQSDLRLYRNRVPTIRRGRQGILYVRNRQLVKLSGYESLLLQGFPREIAIKVKENKLADSTILGQAGNAMTVNVMAALCKQLKNYTEGV